MARIDRLPAAPKAALQVASVVGREFSAQLVERIAELPEGARPALGELRAVENGDADLMTPVAGARHVTAAIPGAQLYVFKDRGHSLYATAPLEFARVVRSFVRTRRPA